MQEYLSNKVQEITLEGGCGEERARPASIVGVSAKM